MIPKCGPLAADCLEGLARTVVAGLRFVADTAVVRSLLGVLSLLAVYALAYKIIYMRGRRFLAIAPFRIWHGAASEAVGDGLAARLGDALQRLQEDMRRRQVVGEVLTTGDVKLHDIEVVPPPAQITVEYAGITPEKVHALLQRAFGCRIEITGELMRREDRLLLVARARGEPGGVWKVPAPDLVDQAFDHALEELAVRALVDLPLRHLRKDGARAVANALVERQQRAMARGEHDEAVRNARLGLVAVPESAIGYFNLGVAYDATGDLGRAIEAYSQALRNDPKYADALNNRGIDRLKLGDYNKAEADLREACSLAPLDPDLRKNLIVGLKKVGRVRETECPALHYDLGVAYDSEGLLEEAVEAYSEVLQRDPTHADALLNRGIDRSELGDEQLAIADLSEVRRLAPDIADAAEALGIAQWRAGQLKEARSSLAESARLRGQRPWAQAAARWIRKVRWKAGWTERALCELRRTRTPPNEPQED